MVDDIHPAVPTIRNIPYFPEFRVLEVMQDFYHQPDHDGRRPRSEAVLNNTSRMLNKS